MFACKGIFWTYIIVFTINPCYVFQTREEGKELVKKHNDPVILIVGRNIDEIESITIVCENKAVTSEMTGDDRVVSGILLLIAVYFAYELEFPADLKFAFTYLQEKLLRIPASGKLPQAYSNFFRASTCVEKSLTERDPDATQVPWECASSWS